MLERERQVKEDSRYIYIYICTVRVFIATLWNNEIRLTIGFHVE